MGAHVLVILQQGIWASATGGWFFDAHQNIFSNAFHLYLWLFLLCLPLTLYLTLAFDALVWGVYCIVIVVVFAVIKVINHRLHLMYDTGVLVEQESSIQSEREDGSNENHSKTSETGADNASHPQGETTEGIEMTTIASVSGHWTGVSMTPPVLCSSRVSVSESSGSGRRVALTPTESLDCIKPTKENTESSLHAKKSHDDTGEWKASSSEAALSRHSARTKDQLNLHVVPKAHRSSDVIMTGRGILRSPRKSHPRRLNSQRASVPVELTLKTGSPGSSCQLQNMSSPAQKGRMHRHRRAVRRVRSTTDTWSGTHGGASCESSDPREPRMVSDEVAAAVHRCLVNEVHGRLKSDLDDIPLETFKAGSSRFRTSSPSSWKPPDPDVSSLSSYKETSPESEMIPPTVVKLPRPTRKSEEAAGRTKTADLRIRTFNYSRDSLETYKERWQRKSQPDRTPHCETAIVHVEPKIPTTLISPSPEATHCGPAQSSDDKTPADLISDSDSSADASYVEIGGKTLDFNLEEKSESSHTLTAAGESAARTSATTVFKEVDAGGAKAARVELYPKSSSATSKPTSLRGAQGGADSQQSSLVGLQWLFSTDSDSQTSGDSCSDIDFTDSSSTLTNEDDVLPSAHRYHENRCHDNRCHRHDDHRVQPKHPKKGPGHKASTGAQEPLPPLSLMSASAVEPSCLVSSDRQLDVRPELAADVEMTEEEKKQLELQRSHGAIPKRWPTAPAVVDGSRRISPESLNAIMVLHCKMRKILESSNGQDYKEELEALKAELSAISLHDVEDILPRMRCRLRRRTHDEAPRSPGVKVDLQKVNTSRESSESNPNESLALLPERRQLVPYCSVAADGDEGATAAVRSAKHPHQLSSRASWCSSLKLEGPIAQNILDSVESMPPASLHIAKSHEDTTEGAVHCFQDEYGNWFMYTFRGDSCGLATSLIPVPNEKACKLKRESSSEESALAFDSSSHLRHPLSLDPTSTTHPELPSTTWQSSPTGLNTYIDMFLDNGRQGNASSMSTDSDDTASNATSVVDKPKHYYEFHILPKLCVKIHIDRLDLLAMLDRNTITENIASIILALGISLLGSLLLAHGFFQDFAIFWMCFVMAGCQYSLLKSVQPDAASPMHGYNRIIVFSRPFYFCLCASLVLALHYGSLMWQGTAFRLYGVPFTVQDILIFFRDLVKVFLLCLPLVFTLGLLPQINTFLIYLLEQIEIHVFGGSATTSLTAAVASFLRSCLSVGILYGLCYAGIKDPLGTITQPNTTQHVLFSVYCGVLVAISYHLSRSTSDPGIILQLLIRSIPSRHLSDDADGEMIDPLPKQLRKSVGERLKSDLVVCLVSAILVFAVSVSTAFSSPILQPMLFDVLVYLSGVLGLLVHYVLPQLRKEMPWLCCSHPILASHERGQFEVRIPAKVMVFEILYLWLRFFERNFVLPAVFLCALTTSTRTIVEEKFASIFFAAFVIVMCSLKMFRSAFTNTSHQFLYIIFTMFFFRYDSHGSSETFLIDYFFLSIVLHKVHELMLKLRFILTYIAPWQITWGSAFHAFAQPFSVPHSAMLFVQAIVSAIVSAPLNPLLGSAIFLTSYVRPMKFWERDYNTKRVDHSNTRLSSQLDRNPGADDNNLNSIFYEHLTRSLQRSLCGDLQMGRWGDALQGDCFIMASDYLNALVHIIELGNGFVTFQLRGLEFRGTYCQQREVEAITEDAETDEGFCCCKPGHLPHFLSLNVAFSQRWLAWEVVVTKYILEGYSISDNSAASMLQVYDLRRILITYYIKSIIYYTVRSPKLDQWLADESIREGLRPCLNKDYVDLDPTFSTSVDEDFDSRQSGVSKNSFCNVYHDWIQYCASRRDKSIDAGRDSWLVTMCFALSLLGRRALGTASHNNSSANVEFFLCGLHALFKGDLRITSVRDEWVFGDMELLRRVVAPGVRMSLKLHQDHFTSPDEYDDCLALYSAISSHEQNMVISHEADPAWRNAVLSNVPSLLALRHVFDEGTDEYKVIMLNKRFLSFRVIKVNRECVRGLWSGQLQELIFLRNRNPERGSIQNAKQALRNMINSSCDQPIGYPIYVSPLTTSYSGTNDQFNGIAGREFSINAVFGALRNLWTRMRNRCGSSCTSGSSMMNDDFSCRTQNIPMSTVRTQPPSSTSVNSAQPPPEIFAFHPSLNRGSVVSNASSASKPGGALSSLAGLIGDTSKECCSQRVQITDASKMFDNINLGRPIDVHWPNEEWRLNGGKSGWSGWIPEKGMEGTVVHRWIPCHRDPGRRSHIDKTILLVQIGERYVPIAEAGLTCLGIDV